MPNQVEIELLTKEEQEKVSLIVLLLEKYFKKFYQEKISPNFLIFNSLNLEWKISSSN